MFPWLWAAMGGKPVSEAATRPYGCSVKCKDPGLTHAMRFSAELQAAIQRETGKVDRRKLAQDGATHCAL